MEFFLSEFEINDSFIAAEYFLCDEDDLPDKIESFLLMGLSFYIYTAVCSTLIGINNVELRTDELIDELSKLCSALAYSVFFSFALYLVSIFYSI
jgi:hypothetical protein